MATISKRNKLLQWLEKIDMPVLQRRNFHILIILLCSFIVLIIMRPLSLYFLNDDFEHIPFSANNIFIRKNFLRPVANLFLLSDRYLFGKWAPGYFFTTWFFHTGCTVSMYYLFVEAIKKYSFNLPDYTALFAALFFLFYPFHAEPLFWIIARGSIISALFAIISIYCYLKKDNNKYLVLSLLFFIAALFTYESVWNLIFIYALISYYNFKKQLAAARKELLHICIFIFSFLLYLALRYFTLDTFTGGYAEIDSNILEPALLASNILKLAARNFTPPFENTTFSIAFFSLSVIIYTIAIVLMFKKNKSAGWLLIILCMALISATVTAAPLGIDTHGNESERYIYYSSFFFCFFLSVVVTLLRKDLKYIAAGFIVILEITGLIVYNAHYRYASAVVKTSLEFIRKYPNYKNAYFIDVPGEYKGALIFRVCLPNAIRWIAPKCKFDSVIVVSKTEDATGIKPFNTGETTWKEFIGNRKNKLQPNTYSLKDTLGREIKLYNNDAVFWFTGKGFYKVKSP